MGGRPKILLPLAGRPLIMHTLDRLLQDARIVVVRVALPETMLQSPVTLLDPRIGLVKGGAERSDSVRAGLDALPEDIDLVLIHDAARPLVSPELIQRVIDAATEDVGVIAALPASDTIHMVSADDFITATPERAALWQAQTPQVFPRAAIVEAHRRAVLEGVSATDDAALVVRYGGKVRVVPGERTNLKITVPHDLELAEAWLARPVE
jgi:2-C-methyl-D-erythritol 4-phosphate cytidylyltransferase